MTDNCNGLEAGDEQPVNRVGVCDIICPQAGVLPAGVRTMDCL